MNDNIITQSESTLELNEEVRVMTNHKEKIEMLIRKLDCLAETMSDEDYFETPTWKELNHYVSLVETLTDKLMSPLVFDSDFGYYLEFYD